MKASEIVNGIKDLLNLSKQEVEKVEVVADIELKEEVELAEDDVKAEPKAEEVKQVIANFATQEELSQVKMELLEMIKSIIEDKSSVGEKEVPQELSSQEIELEVVEEIVHSPEAEVAKKKVVLFETSKHATIEGRINQMLFNN